MINMWKYFIIVDDLQKLRNAMNNQDKEFIYNWLNKTRNIRKEVVELGRDRYTDPYSEE